MSRVGLACVAAIVTMLSACVADEPPMPEVLVLGVLPDRSVNSLDERYRPLADYLQVELDIRVDLVVPDTYAELVDLMAAGDIDIGNFGGYTFVEAARRANAVPLAMRDVDARFTSVIIANGNGSVQNLEDLRGQSFAFGSRLSTSGHLMPRHFLLQQGIQPESFFSAIEFTGSHDVTAMRVRDGEVRGGVVNALVLGRMLADKSIDAADLRIVWETPPYVDYVYAAHPRLDAATRERLVDAFLRLSIRDPQHRRILEALDAKGFLPASMTDFSELAAIVDNLDLDR